MCAPAQGKWVQHDNPRYRGLRKQPRACPAWVQEGDCADPEAPQWHPHPEGDLGYHMVRKPLPRSSSARAVLSLMLCIIVKPGRIMLRELWPGYHRSNAGMRV